MIGRNRILQSARQEAQDIAYKAMQASDPMTAVELCSRALDIDAYCVDALMMMSGACTDLDERAEKLACVVGIAEEDLGGKSFFEENTGHFWGLLETRPYMRARSYLAQTLHRASRIDEAITEYEALLKLNPDDNQGLRYILIGLYLETDNIHGARRLLTEYEDDSAAVFAWAIVLERFLSDDASGAQRALAEAKECNPFVESYLLGRKAIPDVLPGMYGVGDESEAIISVDLIEDAWECHPDALRWLRKHETYAETPPPKSKVGRNDPCPCGSGRKYKKCCLGKDVVPPKVMQTEQALVEIKRAAEGKDFESVEEINEFIMETTRLRNQKPIDDFSGLSAEQMFRFLHFPFDSPQFVTFPDVLGHQPSATIATLFAMLAEAIGEDGLKPTAKGNLPLKVVRDAALAFLGEEKYEKPTRISSIRSEDDFVDLNTTRLIAQLASFVRKYKGKLVLSRECRKLRSDHGVAGVYPKLLRAYAQKYNWAYRGFLPEIGFIQQSFVFSLYLLDKHGSEWRPNSFYEDAFLRAFPALVDQVQPLFNNTPEETIRRCYSGHFANGFAAFAGLIEIERNPNDPYSREFRLRKTLLLGDAVRFSFPHEDPI